MKQPIFLMIGVPGAGKSWVAKRVGPAFEYVHHDGFIGHIGQPGEYVKAILKAWETSDKPLLAEAPFSVSQIKDPLEAAGAVVKPVILSEDPKVLADRYEKDPNRDGKPLPKGHLTRMATYLKRAGEYKAFVGNSTEVLEYLKQQAATFGSAISRRAHKIPGG